MIVLSLILVIAAAVLLIAGFFQTGLTLIYGSIAACVLAMIFLGIGVLQRRRSGPATQTAGGYGPGARGTTTPVRPSGSSRPTSRGASEDEVRSTRPEGDVVVKKTSAADAPKKKAVKKVAARTGNGSAAGEDTAPEPAAAAAEAQLQEPAAAEKATASATAAPAEAEAPTDAEKPAKKAAAKKSATKKKSAKKSTGKKKSTKKSAAKKKSTAKKSATTGAAARARLADVKGVGPAKQDALLERFGSIEAIRDASVDELSGVPGIGAATAKTLKDSLS